MKKMNITEFKKKIQTEDVEGNRTYLWIQTKKCKYGQSYQNATSTIDDMKNRFVMFYYPMYENDNYCECGNFKLPESDFCKDCI
jgi:predicted nucleic-acid-binding Zn-ribbon protein